MTTTRRKGGAATSTVELSKPEAYLLADIAKAGFGGMQVPKQKARLARLLMKQGLAYESRHVELVMYVTTEGRRLAGRAELSGRQKQAIVRDSHKESRDMGKKATRLTKKDARNMGESGAFGAHLAALLAERDWDHHKFAEKLQAANLKISEAGVRVWLRGEGMPKAEMLRAIGRVLGLEESRDILPPGK